KGPSRPRAIVCVFALALVIVVALFGSVVPQLVSESRQLASRVPEYVVRLRQRIEAWATQPPQMLQKILERHPPPPTAPEPTTTTNTASSTTPAPGVGVGSTNSPAFLGGTLEQNTIDAVTNWLPGALPKIGSWLFGQVGRVASWLGVLVGL